MLRIVDAAWLLGLIDTVAQVLDSAEVADLAERALARSNSCTTLLAASRVIPAPRRWALRIALLEGIPISKGRADIDLLSSIVDALLEAPEDVRLEAWQHACARIHGERASVALIDKRSRIIEANVLYRNVSNVSHIRVASEGFWLAVPIPSALTSGWPATRLDHRNGMYSRAQELEA